MALSKDTVKNLFKVMQQLSVAIAGLAIALF